MSQSLPTIVFFAGAFSDPSCFDALSGYLQKVGYPTTYAYVQFLNPSDPTSIETAKDAEDARNKFLIPLLDEGQDVIIFVHSYGGVVGGQAAAGLSKSSREGQSRGVVGLVYLVGNIVCEGESLLQAVGGAYPPFIKEHYPSQGLAVIDPVMDTLYGDVAPEMVPKMEAAMIPHALAAFETPATAPTWADSTFHDKSGVKWDIVDMKTSHCPFISCPEETANNVVRLIKNWV